MTDDSWGELAPEMRSEMEGGRITFELIWNDQLYRGRGTLKVDVHADDEHRCRVKIVEAEVSFPVDCSITTFPVPPADVLRINRPPSGGEFDLKAR